MSHCFQNFKQQNNTTMKLMENKQTAVEWLIEQYNLYRPGQMPQTQFSKVCEQAKEMERVQLEQEFGRGYDEGVYDGMNK